MTSLLPYSFSDVTWADTHAHLSDAQFDGDRGAVIERAFGAGVNLIVEIADGPSEWEKALVLAEKYVEKIWWAGGFHPYYADQVTRENLETLKRLLKHPQFVAIGEVGLDYAKAKIDSRIQKEAFNKIIDFSFEWEKPLIIHCRDAYSDLIQILSERLRHRPAALTPNAGVIHCFSGVTDDAKALVDLGFYIGVDAPVTYPNAHSLRSALAHVPVEKLVLETDSPYLPPQPIRGKRNEPSYIPMIGAALAAVKEISIEMLKKISFTNTLSLYRLNAIVK